MRVAPHRSSRRVCIKNAQYNSTLYDIAILHTSTLETASDKSYNYITVHSYLRVGQQRAHEEVGGGPGEDRLLLAWSVVVK